MKDAIARLSFLLVFCIFYYLSIPVQYPDTTKRKRGDIMLQAPKKLPNTYCCFANKLRKIFIQSAKKKRRLKGF